MFAICCTEDYFDILMETGILFCPALGPNDLRVVQYVCMPYAEVQSETKCGTYRMPDAEAQSKKTSVSNLLSRGAFVDSVSSEKTRLFGSVGPVEQVDGSIYNADSSLS